MTGGVDQASRLINEPNLLWIDIIIKIYIKGEYEEMTTAIGQYVTDVKSSDFPNEKEQY